MKWPQKYTAPRDRTGSSPMAQIMIEFGPGSCDTNRTLRHIRLTRAVLFGKEALIGLVTPLENEWIVQRAATLLVWEMSTELCTWSGDWECSLAWKIGFDQAPETSSELIYLNIFISYTNKCTLRISCSSRQDLAHSIFNILYQYTFPSMPICQMFLRPR